MKIHFIVNTHAGRGKGRVALRELNLLLLKKPHTFQETPGPGQAVGQAQRASSESDIVVAVGGDGTVNEVANGIVGTKCSLGVIPIGSGNDFSRMISVPSDVGDAIELLQDGRSVTVDVGQIDFTTNQSSSTQRRYFVNGLGIGFDAMVALESKQIKMLKGLPLYLMAALRSLKKYKSPRTRVVCDEARVNGRHFLIAVGNGAFAGGGFCLTPQARVDDGVLDVCLMDDLNPLRALSILPSVVKGTHGKFPEIHFLRAKRVTIDSPERLCVHSDGEILGQDIHEIRIELLPQALRVISN